ncbi:MAG: DMT family transporter [Longimicrobiaceae bacterium]
MKSWRVHAALLAVQLLFATLPVAVKFALRDLSSPSIAFLRVTAAALCFVALHSQLSGERVRGAGDYARLALYALFGVVANQLLYITALQYTTATAAQTLVTTGPAITLLVAILLAQERGAVAKWVGIGLAGMGALLLIGVELEGGRRLGNALVLINVVAYSIYLVISRDILRRYQPLTVITWVFLFGTLGIAPWGIPALAAETGAVSTTTLAMLLWIVIGPTVGAYYLNVFALARVEASTVAVYVYLQPIATALLAIPLLGERPSLYIVPAAVLIFSGVAFTAWAGRRARRRAAAGAEAVQV